MQKFRQSPLGRLIYKTDAADSSLSAYTQALLDSSTSEQLQKSYKGISRSKRKTPSIYSVSRSVSTPSYNEITVCWHRINVEGWKPETRQESTLSNFNESLYLIGGVSRSINKDVNVFRIHSKTWQRLDNTGDINEPRFGHSAVKYEGNIIVFGGGTHYDHKHKLRECLSGVHVFYIDTCFWQYMKTQGTYLPARKYHSACVVGCHMLVYGGMNQKNNMLSDAAVLNLKKQTWKSLEICGKSPGKLAFHTSAFVSGLEPGSGESIYKVFTGSGKIAYSGVYVFGGLNVDKKASNILYIIQVGKRPLEWTTPIIAGQPPSPRFLHTMIYNSLLKVLIIFGGRVDLAKTTVYTCFNDVFLLDLQNLQWLRVNVFGEIPIGRSGHTAETTDCRMYVFGGVTNSCYCSGDIWVLEMDPSTAISMNEEFVKKKRLENDINDYKHAQGMTIVNRAISRSRTRRFSRVDLSANP